MIHAAKTPEEFPVSSLLVVQALKITFAHASCRFESFTLTVNNARRERHLLCQLSSTLSAQLRLGFMILFIAGRVILHHAGFLIRYFIRHGEHTFQHFKVCHGLDTLNLRYKNCGVLGKWVAVTDFLYILFWMPGILA